LIYACIYRSVFAAKNTYITVFISKKSLYEKFSCRKSVDSYKNIKTEVGVILPLTPYAHVLTWWIIWNFIIDGIFFMALMQTY